MPDKPVKRSDGRYDNVDFTKAVGFKLPTVKASYLRRDVLLFVRYIALLIYIAATDLPRPTR